MNSVGGFGIANVDIIFGNARRMPKLGEEVYSESCSKQLGGGAVATLIQLSRLGVPVKLATYIGEGPLSRYLVKELEKDKIEYTNMLSTDEEDPVTLSCVCLLYTSLRYEGNRSVPVPEGGHPFHGLLENSSH